MLVVLVGYGAEVVYWGKAAARGRRIRITDGMCILRVL